MNPQDALDRLAELGDPQKAQEMAAYHKVPRPYLGVANPVLDIEVRQWRQELDLPVRLALAEGLWDSTIHEARVAAAKLLTQARIRPDDDAVWARISAWVPDFDAWAVADHASIAGAKRLVADPNRLNTLEAWVQSDHLWTKRAALVMTLPWARLRHPKPAELAVRDRVLGWAAAYVDSPEWFLQKAVAWWLRDLSRKDPDRTYAFLQEFGDRMKPFARREAARLLVDPSESQ